MNNFKLAARALTRKGRGNVIKIVSLGLGLAVGLVLITKVNFEYSYESFYPDADRVFRIMATYLEGSSDGEMKERSDDGTISGGVAFDMGREIPQIEVSTRYTALGSDKLLIPDSRAIIEAKVIIADSCLHDVLPRPVIAGDVKNALSTPKTAIVSRTLAEKIGGAGGDVIGRTVAFDEYPGRSVTIGAVFEDIPENSDFHYEMAISILSIGEYTWDGSMFWDGNDRYTSFVKLLPGVVPDDILPAMREVQKRHADMEGMAAEGVDIRHWLIPLRRVHSDDPDIKQANALMLMLAVSLIIIALLNYLIITLSTVLRRAREVAVHKCYGAGGGDISRQVLAETTLHVALSLGAAALLVGVFRGQVEEILGTSLAALFSWRGVAMVVGVCAVLLVVAAWVPSRLFVNVPAVAVVRRFKRAGKRWKLALLAVQFVVAAAFCAILLVIWLQYKMMMNSDPGYEYENVVYADVSGTSQEQRGVAVETLLAMPGVETVATAYQPLFDTANGDNVYLPGSEQLMFNIADLYEAGDGYFEMMEIPIIEGGGFEKGVSAPNDIIVNRAFAERISLLAGWSDGVVGKAVNVTGHGDLWEFNIVGVFENFRLGAINDLDDRPAALFYTDGYEHLLWVKLREVNGETMRAVQNVLTGAMPDKASIYVDAMKNTIAGLYNNERVERNAIVLCSLITLVIVLLGLVGYLRNEISRRSAEIAIRKINGAGIFDVLGLLGREIVWIAVPALAVGAIVAYYVSERWIAGFSERITLSVWLFAGSALSVLLVILAVSIVTAYGISTQNPVLSLKKDE
jgi:putative ABC transport system permease protein